MATADTIKFDVRCMGCKTLIPKPSDADMYLFRFGIRVHNRDDCRAMVEAILEEGVDRR